jgi:hypothetical protein
MAFPSIHTLALASSYQKTKAYDPTIRARSQAGYVKTRSACTRIPPKWSVTYVALTLAQRDALETHEDAVKVGGDSFTWTDPVSITTHTVRFTRPVEYSIQDGSVDLWKASVEVEEV